MLVVFRLNKLLSFRHSIAALLACFPQLNPSPARKPKPRGRRLAMISWLPWPAAFAVVLISILLHPIVVRIRRRNQGVRPDGLQVLSDPENPKVE